MNKPNTYCGDAKEVKMQGRDPFISLNLDLTELKAKMTDEHIRTWTGKDGTEHRVVNLIIAPVKPENVTKHKTHSVKIVEAWRPDNSGPAQATSQQASVNNNTVDVQEDIPF